MLKRANSGVYWGLNTKIEQRKNFHPCAVLPPNHHYKIIRFFSVFLIHNTNY